MSKIKHKLVVCSGKGGVGKTTVAVNLAAALTAQNLSVGILDVDITGPNVPKMLDLNDKRPDIVPGEERFIPVQGPLNLKVMSMAFLIESPDTPVIWRGPLKMRAIRQFISEGEWGDLDYLVIDLPPGTGDETLDILQLIDDAQIVIVTTPQEVALLDSRKTIMMAKQMHRSVVGIVENMAGLIIQCPKCNEQIKIDLFGTGGGLLASQELDVELLGDIPIEPQIRELGDQGLPFILKSPESASAKAFEEIVKKIRKKLEK
jgi:Mrp family chromosome partitioning ATPase